MMRLLVKIGVSAVALWVADYLLDGFSVGGGIRGYLIVAVVLGLLSALVRPIIKFITFPLIILTLGLFTIIINAAMLALAAKLTGLIAVADPASLLLATLIISAIHLVFNPSTD